MGRYNINRLLHYRIKEFTSQWRYGKEDVGFRKCTWLYLEMWRTISRVNTPWKNTKPLQEGTLFLIHFALSVSSTSENSFSPEKQNKECSRQIHVAKREQRTCWFCAGFVKPIKRLNRKGKLETRCEVIQMTMTSVRLRFFLKITKGDKTLQFSLFDRKIL